MIETFLSHCFLLNSFLLTLSKEPYAKRVQMINGLVAHFETTATATIMRQNKLNSGITTTTMCLGRNDCLVTVVIELRSLFSHYVDMSSFSSPIPKQRKYTGFLNHLLFFHPSYRALPVAVMASMISGLTLCWSY